MSFTNNETVIATDQIEKPIAEKDMAKMIGMCRTKLASLRKTNTVPFISTGKRVYYQPSKVIGALEVLPTAKAQ